LAVGVRSLRNRKGKMSQDVYFQVLSRALKELEEHLGSKDSVCGKIMTQVTASGRTRKSANGCEKTVILLSSMLRDPWIRLGRKSLPST
jgi:hypothetical protein